LAAAITPAIFPPLDLLRQTHPVWNIGLIRLFGQR